MKKLLNEFKEFINKGSVLDLAVGVIIGSAFTGIVTSLVNDIFTPILGIVIGGHDFSNLSIKFKDATINYGSFIQSVINFLLMASNNNLDETFFDNLSNGMLKLDTFSAKGLVNFITNHKLPSRFNEKVFKECSDLKKIEKNKELAIKYKKCK